MEMLYNPSITFRGAGLFTSEEDWIHPERTEITYEIIYVTRGDVYMEENGNEFHLSEGQLCILLPGIRHAGTRVTRGVSFYWVHFSSNGCLPFQKRFFEKFEGKALFKELLHWNNLPVSPEYLVNATLVRIIAEFAFIAENEALKYNAHAEKIKEWIRINANASLSVKTVADHFGYSPDHVSRLLKANYGIGASKLINRMLMSRARELLSNTGKYVKEIAAELGFSSDKEFIGYFKYHEGHSPTEFRQRFPLTHMNRK